MLGSMITLPIVSVVMMAVILCISLLAVLVTKRLIFIILSLVSIAAIPTIGLKGSPEILVKEVSPGIFLDQYGGLHRENVPKGVPVIYEMGNPEHSGYTIRWCWKWVKVIRLDDPYDWRVAEEIIPILCPVEDIISLREDIQIVTIPILADNWWRKKHPQGKVQAEIAFLVTPRDNGNKVRIERYVFQ